MALERGCSGKGEAVRSMWRRPFGPSNSIVKASLPPSPGGFPSTVFLSAIGLPHSACTLTDDCALTFVSQKGTSRHLSNAMQLG